MKTPYGLPVIGDCLGCKVMGKERFCGLPEVSLREWNQIRQNSVYPAHALLFVEDQPAQVVFFICVGQVKLYSTALDGTTVIYRICNSGEFLGLSEALQRGAYETMAETLEPCVLNYVKIGDLERLIRKDPEIATRVARELSLEVQATRRQLRDLRFRDTAIEKLACFLAAWSRRDERLSLRLTHEEIGDILGLARETITRTMRELKNRKIVRVTGHLLTIIDRETLLDLSNGRRDAQREVCAHECTSHI